MTDEQPQQPEPSPDQAQPEQRQSLGARLAAYRARRAQERETKQDAKYQKALARETLASQARQREATRHETLNKLRAVHPEYRRKTVGDRAVTGLRFIGRGIKAGAIKSAPVVKRQILGGRKPAIDRIRNEARPMRREPDAVFGGDLDFGYTRQLEENRRRRRPPGPFGF